MTDVAADRSSSIQPRAVPAVRARSVALGYQPHIDGLRAISVFAVVAFHVGLPGFYGGFVGVDVFFVISGYLIIGQIVAGMNSGTFSFAGFWARRVLRILPPLLLVIVSSLAIAPAVLVLPRNFESVGWEAAFSALMVVNHYFLESQGYFDTAAETKPFLHLWTLAVEEQFYIVAPLVIAGLWAWGARYGSARRSRVLGLAVGGLFSVSFIGCILGSHGSGDNDGFFRMMLRAWEFIAGGVAGFVVSRLGRLVPVWFRATWPAIGLLAIIISIVALKEAQTYPSYFALLPVVGAALVLGGTTPETLAGRLLSSPPFVAIGLLSYSWYLWHWPLLAFVRIANFGESLILPDLAAAVVALFFAVLTYFALERPLKEWRRRDLSGRKGGRVVFAGVAGCVFVALLGIWMTTVVAAAAARSIPQSLIPPRLDEHSLDGEPCALRPGEALDAECLAKAAGSKVGLLLGDSHSRALFKALQQEASIQNARIVIAENPGCAPLLDIAMFRGGKLDQRCITNVAESLQSAEQSLSGKLSFAILYASWNSYLGVPPSDPDTPIKTLGYEGATRAAADQQAAFTRGLDSTVDRLLALGVNRILIIAPTPEFKYEGPKCVLRADYSMLNRAKCEVARSDVEARRKLTIQAIEEAAAEHEKISVIDPLDFFCDANTCRPYRGDTLLFYDRDHLSFAGAETVLGFIGGDLDWVFAD